MRIIHARSAGILSDHARNQLKSMFCQDTNASIKKLESLFPNHVVSAQCGHIRVSNMKGSIFLDLLKDGGHQTHWIETKARLGLTTKRR